jgi:hypothetical protein
MKSPYFARLLVDEKSLIKVGDAIFIDRPGTTFHYVLNYLSTSSLGFFGSLSAAEKFQFTEDGHFYHLAVPVNVLIDGILFIFALTIKILIIIIIIIIIIIYHS